MSPPSAVVLIIIDGLAGVSSKTALQAAQLPTLDAAAARGRAGLIDPVRPGLACGSDTAHLAIFGYNPERCYRGRGAFEAMGTGVEIVPGDIAFKCNFARMDDDTGVVTARCADHSPSMHALAAQFAKRLNGLRVPGFEDVQVSVTHAVNHRCVVRLRGGPLCDAASNTDPLVDDRRLLKSLPTDPHRPVSVRTAEVVNAVSDAMRDALKEEPDNYTEGSKQPVTNVVLLRGAAERIDIRPFEKMHGIPAFLIAPTKIIAGIGMTAGLDIVHADGATGDYNTDLLSKAKTCVEHLMLPCPYESFAYKYAMGIIHVKAVDEAGHEQDFQKKASWLEKADAMTAELEKLLVTQGRRDVVLIITGDHSTPTIFGDHTCEPVPIVFADVLDPEKPEKARHVYVESDECMSFDEVAAGQAGSLGRFPALEIMSMVKHILQVPD